MKTSCDCHVSWTRQGNVKDFIYCDLHSSAHKLLAILKDAIERGIFDQRWVDRAKKIVAKAEGRTH